MHFYPPALAALTLLVWFDTGVHFSSKPHSWVSLSLDSFGRHQTQKVPCRSAPCAAWWYWASNPQPQKGGIQVNPKPHTQYGYYSLSTNSFPLQIWSNSTDLTANIDREDISRTLNVLAPVSLLFCLPCLFQTPLPMFLSISWTWSNTSSDQLHSLSILSFFILSLKKGK